MSSSGQKEKKTSLENIPYEVLTGSLLPFLDVADVTSLSETSWFFHNVALDQHFWRLRTLNTFHLPPQPIRQKGWNDLYKRLSIAQVFTWGSNEFGRLGHNYDNEMRRPVFPMNTMVRSPTEIAALRNEVVVDLGCGGWSMWALTSRGQVYGWGKLEGDEFYGSTRGTPQIIPFLETIAKIAVGRRSCLALAETGNLYVVDLDFKYTARVTISCADVVPDMPSKSHKALHIAVGWKLAAVVFKDLGLMVWKPEIPDDDRARVRDFTFPDGHLMERTCNAIRITRPEDAGDPEITGLMVGEGYLVYLTKGGFVYRVNISDETFATSTPVTSFLLEKFITTPKLSYISGSFTNFGLFNTAGDVFIGTSDTMQDSEPVVLDALQRRGIIQLSWGDWHALALCEDGTVLSWGRELRLNGCLGMGYTDDASAIELGLQVDGWEVSSSEPRVVTKFDKNKFAFCVAAAGWHSAALVADFKIQDARKREW